MKINSIIAASLLAMSIVACGPKGGKADAQVSKAAQALLPKKAQVDSASYLLGINFGSIIKGYDFGDLNYSEILKGMKDFVNSEGDPRDETFASQFKIDPNKMMETINGYLQKRHEYTLAVNSEKETKFLDEVRKNPDVQTTDSGLMYIITEPGSDKKPVSDKDTVVVKYKGTLPDGKVFDESPDDNPAKFSLDRVIKGWTQGMKLIGEGGKATLYIPSNLAYGENGSPGAIEPNTPLTFDVELVSVMPYVEKPAPDPKVTAKKVGNKK